MRSIYELSCERRFFKGLLIVLRYQKDALRRTLCFENLEILLKHRTDYKSRWEKQARFDAAGRFTKWNGWTGGGEDDETNGREGGDESSRLTRHRGRACLISVRRRRCGASAFGPSALSLHPFLKRPEHPVINNGAFWSLRVTGRMTTMVIVSYAGPRGPCREAQARETCSKINDDNDDQK